MRKKKLVTMIAALALTICSATMGALPVNAAENDDVKVMDFVDKDVFSDGEEALNKYDENATNWNLQSQMLWRIRITELTLMQV